GRGRPRRRPAQVRPHVRPLRRPLKPVPQGTRPMRIRPAAAALILLAPLAACTTVQEAVHGPQLAPVGYPAALAPMDQHIIARDMPQPASANSLWRVGARTFFNDQRASKVGDILTVQIDIDDSAKTTNETSTGRSSGVTAGIPHLLGLESSL